MSKFGIIAVSPAILNDGTFDPSLAQAASKAGGAGILDLQFLGIGSESHPSLLLAVNSAVQYMVQSGGICGIKCSIDQIKPLKSTLEILGSVADKLNQNLVVLVPGFGSLTEAVSLAREHGLNVLVETISLQEARLAEEALADAIIVKGHESAGRVGDETTFVLLQRYLKEIKLPLYAQGGIGLHTAAACFVAGAAGAVLDAQLFLSRESPLSPEAKLRLSRMDGSETQVFGTQFGESWRMYSRPGLSAIDEVERTLRTLEGKNGDLSNPLETWRKEITTHAVAAVSCQSPDEAVWLIGQDACFARSLAERYCTTSGIMHALWSAVDEHVAQANDLKPLQASSPLAESHKTTYPIVQGAMTRVSDCAEFAYSVASGGALPFLALALMRKDELDKLMSETSEKLSKNSPPLSWGVGILGFVPQELREEQLAVVRKYKPPFALIAGGRPDQAKALEDDGIACYLHVPSPVLLKSFVEAGSSRFIFEGKECGGHVGPRSSFVLWETMIEILLSAIGPKDDASKYHVLFAGGVHDEVSAAMVAAMAAPLAKAGCRIGVLMGTAYLFTKEAVESGAIVNKFQKAALDCARTVLLETGPGHAIRCIESPYKATFDGHRKKLEQQKKSREEIREELEMMNLGRLRIASKGLTRDPKAQAGGSKLTDLPEDAQWSEGMYMIGQVAALHDTVLTIDDLHKQISAGGTKFVEEFACTTTADAKLSIKREHRSSDDVAIIGMSCMFPKANNLEAFWNNILNKVDAIEEVPKDQWDWQTFYDKDPLAQDKIYSKWGGFLNSIVFDPTRYGIPPSSLATIDAMQLLMLEVTQAALSDAGYGKRPFDRERTSLILANAGHGPITALYALRTMLDWKLGDMDPALKARMKRELPEWTEDTFPGFLGNVAAGRVANRFDLSGVNFAVDAACASSLAALYVGVRELRARTSDMALIAAVDTHNQPGDYLSFSKVHALSPRGKCRTFDATADGIAISEGVAMIVLKRLSDAERDGDRVYAVIKGIAGSSDGRDLSLTAPRPAGQVLSLNRAYNDAGISPSTVSLIEAHGTGTTVGDRAEVEALKQVFDQAQADKRGCAIGSVKSMIGHTKSAAGLASIIKVAKALHHRVLPPTIGVTEPNPSCDFEHSPFYINSETRPWVADKPRRAGVSAFGFGGTNFHTVLEEYGHPNNSQQKQSPKTTFESELFCLRANSREDLIKSIKSLSANIDKALTNLESDPLLDPESANKQILAKLAFNSYLKLSESSNKISQTQAVTLSIVASTPADLKEKLAKAATALADHGQSEIKDPRGIYFNQTPLATAAKVAFLFPGQGSQKINMLRDLAVDFPEIATQFAQADNVLANRLAQPLSNYVYPLPVFKKEDETACEQALTNTHIAQPAVAAANLAMWHLLKTFGIKPDVVAGHSFGEYVALCAAGTFSEAELLIVAEARGRMLSETNGHPKGAMAAVTGSLAQIEELIRELPGVTLANINAPNQCILSGEDSAIKNAVASLSDKKIPARNIPVSAAFHSPHMVHAQDKLRQALDAISISAPTVPVYSNTDAVPHPESPQLIASRLVEHLIKPVQFVKEVEAMYASGARIFVEVGPGSVLTNLTETILEGKPHLAISSDRPGRRGTLQLMHLLGQLAAAGVDIDLNRLYSSRFRDAADLLDGQSNESDKQTSKRPRLLYRVSSTEIKPLGQPKAAVQQGSPAPTMKLPQASDASTSQTTAPKPSAATSAVKQTQPAAQAPERNGAKPQIQPPSQAQVPARITTPPASVPRTAQANPVQTNPMPTHMANGQPANVDQVMMKFQQTMLQMTNSFLETQQNVMLAYLRAKQGAPIDHAQFPIANMQQILSQPELPAASYQAPVQVVPQTHSVAPSASVPPPASNVLSEESPSQAEQAVAPASVQTTASESAVNVEELIAKFLEIVSDRTGYPPEMLDLTLDMEADLGIDSIKRVEILSTFRKLMPESTQQNLEGSIEKLAGIKTLQGIIDWIGSELGGSQGTSPAPNTQQATAEAVSQKQHSVPMQASGNSETQIQCHVSRGRVKVIDLPQASTNKLTGDKIVVVTADGLGVADALVKHYSASGQKTVVLNHSTSENGSKGGRYLADLTKIESVTNILSAIEKDNGKIGGLIHLLSLSAAGNYQATQSSVEAPEALDVRSFFVLSKCLEPKLNVEGSSSFLIAATQLGGDFASSQHHKGNFYPVQAGVVGIAKSLDREFTNTRVRVIDFAADMPAQDVASALAEESVTEQGPVEIGRLGARRIGLEVIPEPVNSQTNGTDSIALDSSSVVLITGGARGITAELAQELADAYKPILLIVGKSPRPEATEASDTAQFQSTRELKAAIMEKIKSEGKSVSIAHVESTYQKIMRDREIRTNLSRLEKSGAKVQYFACDVQDPQAFGSLIDTIYEMFGKIDGVIHGAGVIEDSYIKDKSLESFDRVFHTKVNSALTLSHRLNLGSMKFLFFLSSVVGRTGNAGQCDYVAANEVMNKLAVSLDGKTPCRVASIMWGPWRGGMARPELESIFAQQGWSMIDAQSGRRAFSEEMQFAHKGDVEVLLVGMLNPPQISGNNNNGHKSKAEAIEAVTAPSSGARLHNSTLSIIKPGHREHKVIVDPSYDAYLNDHKFDSVPVMPMAMALEMMAEAATQAYAGWQVSRVDKMDIPSGIVFDGGAKELIVVCEETSQKGDQILLNVSVNSKAKLLRPHFKATIELSKSGQVTDSRIPFSYQVDSVDQKMLPLPTPDLAYREWLFHGPRFQGITSIDAIGINGAVGKVHGSNPSSWLATTNGEPWVIDPVLLDSAMQVAGVWARKFLELTVIPTGFRVLHVLGTPDKSDMIVRVFIPEEIRDNLMRCDLAVWRKDGTPVLWIEGLGGIGTKSLNRLSEQPKVVRTGG